MIRTELIRIESTSSVSKYDKRQVALLIEWKKRYKNKSKNFKEVLDNVTNK